MSKKSIQNLFIILLSVYLVGCSSLASRKAISESEYFIPETLNPPIGSMYTIEEEHARGMVALAQIRNDPDVICIEDRRIIEYVTGLVRDLISHVPTDVPRVPISIYIINSQDSFSSRAVTIIGGSIFLQIKSLAQSASEDFLATQLSHEIGHVFLRHPGRWESQRTYFSDYMEKRRAASDIDPRIPPITAGDLQQFELYLINRILISEDEADIFSVQLAVASGYDPHEYMRDLAEKNSFPGFMVFLNHHRSGHERAALMEQEFQNSKARSSSNRRRASQKSSKQFKRVREVARGIVRTQIHIQ